MANTLINLDSMAFYYKSSGDALYYLDDQGTKRNSDGSIYKEFTDISSEIQVGSQTSIFTPSTLEEIFQTDSGPVYSLLNIDDSVNLAAISNKLYLIYGGILPEFITTTTTTNTETTSTTTMLSTTINVTFPINNTSFVLGSTVEIQWTSNKSVNDAVQIELMKANKSVLVIDSKAVNDGSYEWEIPLSLATGNDYTIKVTWLNTEQTGDENSDQSGQFALVLSTTTTTSTTTPYLKDSDEFTGAYYGIPILVLPEWEYITDMMVDTVKSGILFATSYGRILFCSKIAVNAYLTGNRRVFAEVKNGFGNKSDTTWTNLLYALHRRIAEINSSKEIVKWKYEVDSSAIITDRISGIFLSPILVVKEDLGFWKQLMWKENKPTDTEIIICIRTGTSEDDLKSKTWDFCFVSRDSDRGYGSTGWIIRDLQNLDLKGQYIQFKITMTTDSKNISPSMINLVISYSTKYALYFFTTKFVLESDSDLKTGLIVANITEPQNTEIKFGIANKNSSDWNDYTVVELNKLFNLNDFDRFKVGIKMINYGDNIPQVAEFALVAGGLKDNTVNL